MFAGQISRLRCASLEMTRGCQMVRLTLRLHTLGTSSGLRLIQDKLRSVDAATTPKQV
ncbi:MAG: hypothetical protein IIB56_11835 [Planctomycetes bacterium]|nr:hypothetical protein [Planctomycetota bacterium]